jgi:hypothetical protein
MALLTQSIDAIRTAPINHVCLFENPLLRDELAGRANELFALEMKLRRILSVIYLHAYAGGSEYDLLREESVSPMTKDLQPEQMQHCCENEFFHITFGDYRNLNNRPDPRQIIHLLEHIRSQTSYEALRSELTRRPILDDQDANLISSLREWMDPIEKMRNCVAHNRKPSTKLTNDYTNALPLVNQALDNYLSVQEADWRDLLDTGPLENNRAREAIEYALANAEWNQETHTVRLRTKGGRSIHAGSRDDLTCSLRNLCSDEWHAYASRIDGEFVGICDDATWVDEALEPYQDQLARVFPDESAEVGADNG